MRTTCILFFAISLFVNCNTKPTEPKANTWMQGKWVSYTGCSPDGIQKVWIRDGVITVVKQKEIYNRWLNLEYSVEKGSETEGLYYMTFLNAPNENVYLIHDEGKYMLFNSTVLTKSDTVTFPDSCSSDSAKPLTIAEWMNFRVYPFPFLYENQNAYSPTYFLFRSPGISDTSYEKTISIMGNTLTYWSKAIVNSTVVDSFIMKGTTYFDSDTLYTFPDSYFRGTFSQYWRPACLYQPDALLLSTWNMPIKWICQSISWDSVRISGLANIKLTKEGAVEEAVSQAIVIGCRRL